VALTESDLSELLAALKAGEMTDTIRSSLEWILRQLIEAEATAVIGASPHERTETRTAQRNGHRPKLVSTAAGDVELAIPKLRAGSFFPSLLERRRRIDRALYAVVMEAYVHGISTRKVDDLVKALGAASGISKSEVSRICAELDRDLGAFRDRPLDHVRFPYVFVDATYVKGRVRGRVVSRAVVIATGVTATGDREVLGIDVGDSEDGAFWTAFLKGLRARGLGGVQLVVSDHHLGLKTAIAAVFVGAAWQRCRVHFMLGGSLRSPERPARSLRSRSAVSPGWISCWPRLGAPVTKCRARCGSGGSRRWHKRSLSCRTQLCRSGPAAPLSMVTDPAPTSGMNNRWGVAGADAHKHSITIAVLDSTGGVVDEATFDITSEGVVELMDWLQGLPVEIARVGIEGSAGWGLPVAEFLVRAGVDVREVNPARTSDRRRRRRRPKTDREDARAIAREVLADEALPPAVAAMPISDAHVEITVVCERRRSLVRRRQRLLNEAEAVLAKLPLQLRAQLPHGAVRTRLRVLARIDPTLNDDRVVWLTEMLADLLDWEARIKQLEARLPALLDACGSTLTQEVGIAAVSAAELVAEVGDPTRFRSEGAFARWAGIAPVAVSSGEGEDEPDKHRLDLLGNRTVNRILYVMSITQARHDPTGRAFLDRKRTEGKTKKQARRAHKRQLANRVIRRMWADHRRVHSPPTPKLAAVG
jgi:transposase